MSAQPAALSDKDEAPVQILDATAPEGTVNDEMEYPPDILTNSTNTPLGTNVEPSELTLWKMAPPTRREHQAVPIVIKVKRNSLTWCNCRYVILMQGIANREWTSQKRWKTWRPLLDSMGLWDNTVQAYNYDIESSNPMIFTKDGLENEAARLIESLIRIDRRYSFVALDIGGILVKKALILASLELATYGPPELLHVRLVESAHPPSNVLPLTDPSSSLRAVHIELPRSNKPKTT
ncbi:hypothetical protein BDV10DRAFT_190148 [Aspergillus recurvatus]